jgi:hypothetical protein
MRVYTKAYNMQNRETRDFVEKHFPHLYGHASHTQASREIHQYNSYFKTVKEREAARQLREEGRITFEGIESAGLPESFGEWLDNLTHFGYMPGTVKVPLSEGKQGEPPAGTPKAHTEGGASEHGEEEVSIGLSWVGELFKALAGDFLRVVKAGVGIAFLLLALVLFARAGGDGGSSPSRRRRRAITPAGRAVQVLRGTGARRARRDGHVSPARRARVTAAAQAEQERQTPETGRSGRELHGQALVVRQRKRVRERAELLS